MKYFSDSTLSTREINADGFLQATSGYAKPGIQEYSRGVFEDKELPSFLLAAPNLKTIRILRSKEEVFSKKSLASFTNKPITQGHPIEGIVTPKNIKQVQVGFTTNEPIEVNGIVTGNLIVQDENAIQSVLIGKDQISAGYTADVEWKQGVHPVFGKYDGVQKNIRVNHIAIVRAGRAGSTVRINDAKETQMEKTLTINGVEMTFTDEQFEAVESLVTKNKELSDSIEAKDADLLKKEEELVLKETAFNDQKEEFSKVSGELEAEKALKLTAEQLDGLVAKRINLVDSARSLDKEIEATGKTDKELKELCIKKVLGDSFDLTDKEDSFIDGVFETILNQKAETKESDTLAKTLVDTEEDKETKQTAAEKYSEATRSAWQNK